MRCPHCGRSFEVEGGDDVPLLAVKLSAELLEAARDFYERGEFE